jgi:hypothetical protein
MLGIVGGEEAMESLTVEGIKSLVRGGRFPVV